MMAEPDVTLTDYGLPSCPPASPAACRARPGRPPRRGGCSSALSPSPPPPAAPSTGSFRTPAAWRGIGFPALNLTHNALYHVIEAVALLLMFLGARRLLVPTGAMRAGAPHGR